MRKQLLLLALLGASCAVGAQTTATVTTSDTSYTLDEAATKQILAQLKIDTARFLNESAAGACTCVDSVAKLGKQKQELLNAIHSCLAQASIGYQGAMKVYHSMEQPGKEIIVSTDPNDPGFRTYYYIVENRTRNECASLKRLLVTNDDVTSESSYSNNKKSREAYTKGTGFMEAQNYPEAIKWLEKAVQTDPEFAFAWDNLGLCYRRSNKLEKAVNAYRTSIKVDSMGRTPLMNLPVALGLLGRADEAVAAYQLLLSRYPGDPEAYYGIGQILLTIKKDYPAALDNLCQAYLLYIKMKSPYRSDAESLISQAYRSMKSAGQEAEFDRILARYQLTPDK
ncbi:tetratricopeptide repeat protein [Flaviaesturariibacter aridisoli]|nr:tetratricopeptide repeat protein [Flaviaesturariibacter aridisoli]